MLNCRHRVPAAVLIVLAFCLFEGRQLLVLHEYSVMLDCDGCLERTAFWRELELLLCMLCADLVARRWLPRWAWLVRLLVVGVLVICALDWWVRMNFFMRLDWREVQKFWGELDSAAFFLRLLTQQVWWKAVGVACAAVAVLGVCATYVLQRWQFSRWCLAAALPLLLLCLLLSPGPQYHEVYVRHALAAFFNPPTVHRVYSPAWIGQHMPRLRDVSQQRVCVTPATAQPRPEKVVLVVVESLSNYQSRAYGGMHDWTPQLDRWSAKGRQLTHFIANGKTTEDGLFALLTGQIPIVQNGQRNIYASKLVPTRPTLPQILNEASYHTTFMTSGNLAFMNKREWLQKVGFQTISGHDDPFYEGMQRYHFDAAWDEALYARAFQWMKQQQGAYFLVLETVSTHQPYFDPIAKGNSMEGAFRYADAALGDFLDTLERDGFFADGLVVVTSDHRAMVPASAQEYQQLGADHLSRVPLLILGNRVEVTQESGVFSQQDLLPSIQHLLAQDETCLYPGQGLLWNMSGTPHAQCIFMVRAQAPDSEFLRCGGKTFEIRLNGEDTQYVGAPGPSQYIDAIHVQRLAVEQ